MFDLLIKNGRVIDPVQNLDDDLDIAINDGKIIKISKSIPSSEGNEIIDARAKIITPGLIDVHCHVYDGIVKISTHPDDAGVKQGVTTVADGGSAGEAIFGGFPKYVIPSSLTTVFCFLNLSSHGFSKPNELQHRDDIDPDAMSATIESNLNIIKGIKLRLVGDLVASAGLEIVKIAKQVARRFGLPIMVHIGDEEKRSSPTLTQELLLFLEHGDILSHVYTAKWGNILHEDGSVLPQVNTAIERGVVLDTAIGRINFNYNVAKKCMAQGIFPTTISTDLTAMSIAGPIYGLTVTMSKFMALGLDLKRLIEMTTINPARVLGIENELGSLKPGMKADISILELVPGTWNFTDSEQNVLTIDILISPKYTIKSGRLIPAMPLAEPKSLD